MNDILHVLSRFDVNPVAQRFYVVDGDGDILGMERDDTAGFESKLPAINLAVRVMENHEVEASVARWKKSKDKGAQPVTVWSKNDGMPEPEPAPGIGHVDYGTW